MEGERGPLMGELGGGPGRSGAAEPRLWRRGEAKVRVGGGDSGRPRGPPRPERQGAAPPRAEASPGRTLARTGPLPARPTPPRPAHLIPSPHGAASATSCFRHPPPHSCCRQPPCVSSARPGDVSANLPPRPCAAPQSPPYAVPGAPVLRPTSGRR